MKRFLPALAVVACGTMWGVFWMPLRWISGAGLGAAWVSLILSAITVLCALPWAIRPKLNDGEFAGFAVTGLLLGSAFTLYSVSLLLTDVIHSILLFYLTPLWSTLGSRYFFGRRLGWRRGVALLLGFAGMAIILGWESGVLLPRNLGDWLALASGILWVAGSIRTIRHRDDLIALPVMMFGAGGTLCSAVILGLAAAAGSELADASRLVNTIPPVLLVAALFFVPPTFLVLWASQRMDPGRVGILLMGEVLVGAASAAAFSDEPFTASDFLGTVLIV